MTADKKKVLPCQIHSQGHKYFEKKPRGNPICN
ncbi:hypothetical protein OF001_U140036 [Pseudomonas sp. OF001]|nr:hypothetical protein OF001_U140036 [Pseudomonas sp. OF001]